MEFIRKRRLSQILVDTINWKSTWILFSETYDIANWNQVTWKASDVEIEKPISRNVKKGKKY